MGNKALTDSFQLQDGEKIIMHEDFREQIKNWRFWFILSIASLFYIFIGYYLDIIIFGIIILITFIILNLFITDIMYQQKRYILFITNKRAIMIPRKSFLPYKVKKREIFLKNIDFFYFKYNEIIIYEKAFNGIPFFKENEKEDRSRLEGLKYIFYYMSKKNVLIFKKQILDILIDLTKAKKHPNLSEVYISNI